jgi:hypothetical protein
LKSPIGSRGEGIERWSGTRYPEDVHESSVGKEEEREWEDVVKEWEDVAESVRKSSKWNQVEGIE